MRMTWLAPISFLLTALCLPTVSSASVELSVLDACDRQGVAGIITDGLVSSGFKACATPEGAFAEIEDSAGNRVMKVLIDERADTLTIRIAGVTLSDSNTDDEIRRMRETLQTPGGELVARELWRRLAADGVGVDSPARERALAAIGVVATVYGQSSDDDSCFGCCGPGCWGCSGCYTPACGAHDACVRVRGHWDPFCQRLLPLAAASMACCAGFDLGPLCP
jgi:hypothetical protein